MSIAQPKADRKMRNIQTLENKLDKYYVVVNTDSTGHPTTCSIQDYSEIVIMNDFYDYRDQRHPDDPESLDEDEAVDFILSGENRYKESFTVIPKKDMEAFLSKYRKNPPKDLKLYVRAQVADYIETQLNGESK